MTATLYESLPNIAYALRSEIAYWRMSHCVSQSEESDWRRKELHDIIRNFKECTSNLQLDRPHSNTTASSAHDKKNTHCSGSRAGEVNSDGDDVE